jgi:hypothetical protein
MLLYSQVQEGLSDELMHSPAVTRALTYPELCIAAKNEKNVLLSLQDKISTIALASQSHAQETSGIRKQDFNSATLG